MKRILTVVSLSILSLGLHAHAQEASEPPLLPSDTLLENSPFIPPDWEPPRRRSRPSRNDSVRDRDLEFRGVYQLGGEYRFNISNRREKSSEWVRVDDSEATYDVVRFDPKRNVLFIRLNGTVEELALTQPSDNPMPVQLASAPPKPPDPEKANRDRTTRRVITREARRSNRNNEDDGEEQRRRVQLPPGIPPPPPGVVPAYDRAFRNGNNDSGGSNSSGGSSSGGNNSSGSSNASGAPTGKPPELPPNLKVPEGGPPNFTPPPPPGYQKQD